MGEHGKTSPSDVSPSVANPEVDQRRKAFLQGIQTQVELGSELLESMGAKYFGLFVRPNEESSFNFCITTGNNNGLREFSENGEVNLATGNADSTAPDDTDDATDDDYENHDAKEFKVKVFVGEVSSIPEDNVVYLGHDAILRAKLGSTYDDPDEGLSKDPISEFKIPNPQGLTTSETLSNNQFSGGDGSAYFIRKSGAYFEICFFSNLQDAETWARNVATNGSERSNRKADLEKATELHLKRETGDINESILNGGKMLAEALDLKTADIADKKFVLDPATVEGIVDDDRLVELFLPFFEKYQRFMEFTHTLGQPGDDMRINGWLKKEKSPPLAEILQTLDDLAKSLSKIGLLECTSKSTGRKFKYDFSEEYEVHSGVHSEAKSSKADLYCIDAKMDSTAKGYIEDDSLRIFLKKPILYHYTDIKQDDANGAVGAVDYGRYAELRKPVWLPKFESIIEAKWATTLEGN